MEHHFPEFPEKRTTLQGIPRFSKVLTGITVPFVFTPPPLPTPLPPKLPEFSV